VCPGSANYGAYQASGAYGSCASATKRCHQRACNGNETCGRSSYDRPYG
jgi:hypothetical protein